MLKGSTSTSRFPATSTFIALSAVSLILWFHPLLNTMALALVDDRYTHILSILPIAAVLIYLQSKGQREQGSPSLGYGTLLLLALLLAALAKWENPVVAEGARLTVSMFGLVTWWIGSFLFCFGVNTFRAFLFPLTFLYWLVPLPAVVLNWVIAGLQWGSALAAELLYRLSGTPVSLDNLVLSLPGLELEVAPECSSIRSSLILIVTAMMLAQILLRSPWRKLLVIAVALPLSVAKNGLRIFAIGWLTIHVDPAFLEGRLHREGGIVFFAVALAGIFVLLWILYRGERNVRTDGEHRQAR